MSAEPFERNKQFDLDFYRANDDGYSTAGREQNEQVARLAKQQNQKLSTKVDSIVRDPDIRKFLVKEVEEEKAKEVDVGFLAGVFQGISS